MTDIPDDHDLKDEIRVLFTRRKGFNIPSMLIAWWLSVPYSHVCLYVYSRYLKMPLIYEASVRGVTLQPMVRWSKKHDVIKEKKFTIDAQEKRRLIRKAVSYCGTPYGWWSILGIFLKEARVGVDGRDTFICSEFVYDIMRPHLEEAKLDQDHIDPKELWEIIDNGDDPNVSESSA
jgi:hypothetical protein